MKTESNRVLVVAPHPDDEVLGCGATIARHARAGERVWVVVSTNGFVGAPELFDEEQVRTVRAEAKRAHEVLGVERTLFCDFPAPALDAFPSYKISLEFSKIMAELRPTHLYLPHDGDIHVDHGCVYRAALVSARPNLEHTVGNIYCYETLSETEWAPMHGADAFVPNHFVDVADTLAVKLEAMSHFESQLRPAPHPRSKAAIETLARFRGATVCKPAAEAFCIERQILD